MAIRFEHRNKRYTLAPVSGSYSIIEWNDLGSSRKTIGKIATQSKTEAGVVRSAKKKIDSVKSRVSTSDSTEKYVFVFD